MEISNASGIARIARKLRVNCAYPHHPTPTPVPHPLSGIPPEQQRSGKCPTNPGTTPANHGQPGGVMQVLTVLDHGIAYAGF